MLENSLTKDKIINEFQKKAKDTGSSEVQIALLTKRINPSCSTMEGSSN